MLSQDFLCLIKISYALLGFPMPCWYFPIFPCLPGISNAFLGFTMLSQDFGGIRLNYILSRGISFPKYFCPRGFQVPGDFLSQAISRPGPLERHQMVVQITHTSTPNFSNNFNAIWFQVYNQIFVREFRTTIDWCYQILPVLVSPTQKGSCVGQKGFGLTQPFL